jgi:hypothetical protein
MYGHCFVSSEEGSILADMSTRLMPEAAQREEGLHSTLLDAGRNAPESPANTPRLWCAAWSRSNHWKWHRRECEKAAAVKVQHEADTAGFHAATAKSAAL